MIARLWSALKRALSWFRRGPEARGTVHKGSHSAFGRTFSLIQLTAGRRPYLLYLPEHYTVTERLPMVVMMHGCRQDAEVFAAATRMNRRADRERFIVLYPEQRRLANPHRCWNWFSGSAQAGAGEASILADMIRSLAVEHDVEPRRVYLAGLSAGAAMSVNLAVSHPDLFAACALHSGLMFEAGSSTSEALDAMRHGAHRHPEDAARRAYRMARGRVEAIPVMVIHGDRDETVNPVNADQIVLQFTELNRLLGSEAHREEIAPRVRRREERSLGGYRYDVTDHDYLGRTLVRQVTVRGLGHAWSGGLADYPYNDPLGPDAAGLICDFFAEHGLRSGRASLPAQSPA